jgi:tRNA-splicing endonuclease subunit sen54 N-term
LNYTEADSQTHASLSLWFAKKKKTQDKKHTHNLTKYTTDKTVQRDSFLLLFFDTHFTHSMSGIKRVGEELLRQNVVKNRRIHDTNLSASGAVVEAASSSLSSSSSATAVATAAAAQGVGTSSFRNEPKRVVQPTALSVIEWDDIHNIGIVRVFRGKLLQQMGVSHDRTTALGIEEIMFLLERGRTEFVYQNASLSIQEAYGLLSSMYRSCITDRRCGLLASPTQTVAIYIQMRLLGYIVRRITYPVPILSNVQRTQSSRDFVLTQKIISEHARSQSKKKLNKKLKQIKRQHGNDNAAKIRTSDRWLAYAASQVGITPNGTSQEEAKELQRIGSVFDFEHEPDFVNVEQLPPHSQHVCCMDDIKTTKLEAAFRPMCDDVLVDVFFVWAPMSNGKFKRSNPRHPHFCMVVWSEDRTPMAENSIWSKLRARVHPVALRFAVMKNDKVCFFEVDEVLLPAGELPQVQQR